MSSAGPRVDIFGEQIESFLVVLDGALKELLRLILDGHGEDARNVFVGERRSEISTRHHGAAGRGVARSRLRYAAARIAENRALPGKETEHESHGDDGHGKRSHRTLRDLRHCGLARLRSSAPGQFRFHVRVKLQARARFDLRDDPACFLARINLIGERKTLAVFGAQADGIQHVLTRAALLRAGNRDNRSDLVGWNLAAAADAENFAIPANFAGVYENACLAEERVEQSPDQQQVEEAEYHGERRGGSRCEEVDYAAPNQREQEQAHGAGRTAKGGKVESPALSGLPFRTRS